MKKTIYLLLLVSLIYGCKKATVLAPSSPTVVEKEITMVATKEATGSFIDGVHPTSGKVIVLTDKMDAKKKYLSFENFKTDAGPDLRIYLAEDLKAKSFTEVAKLEKTGTFLLDIPTTAMLEKQKYVLIWCEDFSVLFGSAKLE
jgi:Electron transfer DM13